MRPVLCQQLHLQIGLVGRDRLLAQPLAHSRQVRQLRVAPRCGLPVRVLVRVPRAVHLAAVRPTVWFVLVLIGASRLVLSVRALQPGAKAVHQIRLRLLAHSGLHLLLQID